MAPNWRVAFLTDIQSTTGQSGGELVGAHGAKLYARERAAIRKSSNKRLVPFFAYCGPIFGVEIWTQNWVHQFAQQLNQAEKPDPVFGPPKLAWFCSGGQLAATLFSPCQVTASWRMARYVDAKFADKEVLFLNAEEI